MYVTKDNSKNMWFMSGYISKTFVSVGQFGPYGKIILAVDDGYYSKKEKKFVERTQFIAVDVGKLKDSPALNVGDYLDILGKFELEQWEDNDSKALRSEVKLKVLKINVHIPVGICKMLKEQGFIKPNKNGNSQQHSGQPPQQGGYAQQRGGQPPQQGGYAQQRGSQPPQQGGYAQQRGGQPPQQGGYAQQRGSQPPQSGGYAQQRGSQPPQSGEHGWYDDSQYRV